MLTLHINAFRTYAILSSPNYIPIKVTTLYVTPKDGLADGLQRVAGYFNSDPSPNICTEVGNATSTIRVKDGFAAATDVVDVLCCMESRTEARECLNLELMGSFASVRLERTGLCGRALWDKEDDVVDENGMDVTKSGEEKKSGGKEGSVGGGSFALFKEIVRFGNRSGVRRWEMDGR